MRPNRQTPFPHESQPAQIPLPSGARERAEEKLFPPTKRTGEAPALPIAYLPSAGKARASAAYAVLLFLCVAMLVWILRLWRADLTVPFCYHGDQLNNLMIVKGIIDNGWHLNNEYVGAPTGLDLRAYPFAANLDMLLMKAVALFSANPAVVVNVYFLATFPLTALVTCAVLRRLGLSFGPALVGSLLYTFTPYHLLRGEHHLFIGSYFTLPPMVMVLTWLFQDRLALGRSLRTWSIALAVGALVASAMPYYAFFSCCFLLIAGIARARYRREMGPLWTALVLVAATFAALLANLAPTLIAVVRHPGPLGVSRHADEAEWNGMKIAQLLLPITGHRVPAVAEWKNIYNRSSPLVNENDASALGVVGAVGFLILIGRLFGGGARGGGVEELGGLSLLNLTAVLLGTVGGFGSLFNLFVTPWIRGYNRISIFIAFFALLAVCLLLERLGRAWRRGKTTRLIYYGLLGVVLGVGTWDQTSKGMIPPYRPLQEEYVNDAAFVWRIEAVVPEHARIWQLPEMAYPEDEPFHRMGSFDHFRGYIHSRTLHWSFGPMRGSEGERWLRAVAALKPAETVAALAEAGFDGIYLDRYAYLDRAVTLEAELAALLGTAILESDNKRFSFLSMTAYNKRRAAGAGATPAPP